MLLKDGYLALRLTIAVTILVIILKVSMRSPRILRNFIVGSTEFLLIFPHSLNV